MLSNRFGSKLVTVSIAMHSLVLEISLFVGRIVIDKAKISIREAVRAFTRSLRFEAKKVTGHLGQVIWSGDKKRRCSPAPPPDSNLCPIFQAAACIFANG